ncbi:fibrobacter succinogenes major paralogous domain-containing protein [Ekhidna sp.]|uniref:fibrobacter succinogenes major paralogous domain-containing protein n=1 Tax=Ekhidna sp. TaxID=2608089 RepID=UPI00351491BE
MKHLISRLLPYLLTGFLCISCGGDSDNNSPSLDHDGIYHGAAYNGTTVIGVFTLTVSSGNVVGTYYSGSIANVFTAIVATGGNANFEFNLLDGTTVSVSLAISSDTKITGSFDDSEGNVGLITGYGSHTDYDGNYSGTLKAFGQNPIGTYSIMVENGFVTGDFSTTPIYGFVDGDGELIGNAVFIDESIISLFATISEGAMTGSYTKTDNTTGTIEGIGGGGCPETVTDIDGNIYTTILVGNLCWTVENLRTTKYRDGSSIPTNLSGTAWEASTTGAYSDFGGTIGYANTYGLLYNWYAVTDTRGLCPQGWHVSTQAEALEVINSLGGTTVAGGKLKQTGTVEAATGLFFAPNTAATDEIGMTLKPGGYRKRKINVGTAHEDGAYQDINYIGAFWSSSEANDTHATLSFAVYHSAEYVDQLALKKSDGYSCRCVKDQ